MIDITVFDIPGGEDSKVLGTFESVQMTRTVLRDPNGDMILQFYKDGWFDMNGDKWYDWCISVENLDLRTTPKIGENPPQ